MAIDWLSQLASKSKKFPQKKGSKENNFRQQKSNRNKEGGERGTAAQVCTTEGKGNGAVTLTQEQIEQLLRLLPQSSRSDNSGEEDFDNFAGKVSHSHSNVVCCSCSIGKTNEWILETGATDHMSPRHKHLVAPQLAQHKSHINLPDGRTNAITHTGDFETACGLKLKDVLCVPSFQFNL